MQNKMALAAALCLVSAASSAVPVYADVISPQIKDRGKVYSKEKPDVTYYGTGIGARMVEASELRFEVERLLQDEDIEGAVRKARKAVQLDPADPTSHLLLARAITKQFYAKPGPVDEKLLAECLAEWRMLWHHNADQHEQLEARQEARKLTRLAKALEKEKLMQEKARQEAREQIAKQRQREGNQQLAQRGPKEAAQTTNAPAANGAQSTAGGANAGAAASGSAATTGAASAGATSGSSETQQSEGRRRRFLLF